jgi:probable HAF family extracellular repeat protein
VIDLGTLGGEYASATSINNDGKVVGSSSLATGASMAFLWSRDKMTDLGTVPGGKNSAAYSINDKDEIVGVAIDSKGHSHPAVWKNGKVQVLTFAGDSNQPYAINNRGQITGLVFTQTQIYCYLYSDGRMYDIGTLGGNEIHAKAINDQGEIVGDSETSWKPSLGHRPGAVHAFLFFASRLHDLGVLPNADVSLALGINRNGDVVGKSSGGTWDHAFLRRNGKMVDLGTLGGERSSAEGINNQDEIVGSTNDKHQTEKAFLWVKGRMIDLNTLLVRSPGWLVTDAHAINDRGQIIADATINGQNRAVLLNPLSAGK